MSGLRTCFWDIETSPNIVMAWRAGWKQTISPASILKERAIICACWKWEGEKKVHHLEWDKGCDKGLLEQLLPVLLEADILIGHNADKFDLRWVNGRTIRHGLDPLPWDIKTVDTLKIARRRFYLNSNKLDYLSKFLGRSGKPRTEYAWWRDILVDHCPKAMKKMVRYCKADVVELEWIYGRLKGFEQAASHAGVFDGLAKWSCPACASTHVHHKKKRVTAKGTEQHRMMCQKCHRWYQISHRSYLEYGAHMIEQRKLKTPHG